jgi:primosomal protein N' (replication factor Y)
MVYPDAMDQLELGELPEATTQDALFAPVRLAHAVRADVARPVAHVCLENVGPQLDRVFDYLVPPALDAQASVGSRVAVPISGRKATGFVVARDDQTTTGSRLRPILRVISPLPVLAAEIYQIAARIAERNCSSVADILRLAIPARHARAEREYVSRYGPFMAGPEPLDAPLEQSVRGDSGGEPALEFPEGQAAATWMPYTGGAAFLARLARGESPHAVCHALPGSVVELALAACAATRASGRGVLIVVPTSRIARSMAEIFAQRFGDSIEILVGEAAPESRYRSFLRVRGGQAPIVIGTRAAAWAPVSRLGLVIVIDDAAPTLREIRSPYAEARDVLAARAALQKSGLLVLSHYVSVPAAALIASGWAPLLEATPSVRAVKAARVTSPEQWVREGTPWSRIPDSAFTMVRDSLTRGPVLLVVPRAGYIPVVACAQCQRPAVCADCGGEMQISAPGVTPACSRCGSLRPWRCSHCHGTQMKALRIGSHRTAEEIGRAFPGVGVVISGSQAAEGISVTVSSRPRIIVATPGAEPWADGGFAGALVLDSRYLRGQGMDADIAFVRHASAIVARVRPAEHGGHVMFAGGIDPEALHALAHWDLAHYAATILRERTALALPPAARWLAVTGSQGDMHRYLRILRGELLRSFNEAPEVPIPHEETLFATGVRPFAPGIDLLGPVPAPREEITLFFRTAITHGRALTRIARNVYRLYTAENLGATLRLEVDPRM